MGVFQRKVDQSMSPPLRTNVKRRSGADKRRFSHPADGKWPPTLPPGPEVVEADLNNAKGSVNADEFSAWTQDGSGLVSSAPNLGSHSSPGLGQSQSSRAPLGFVLSDPGVPSVPPPRPRTRTSKDPYAKRKAKFEQKPKLAPITESEMDSRRSSQASGASSRNSQASIDSSLNVVRIGDVDSPSNVSNSVDSPSSVGNIKPPPHYSQRVESPSNTGKNAASTSTDMSNDPYEPVEVVNGVMSKPGLMPKPDIMPRPDPKPKPDIVSKPDTKQDDMVEYINSGSVRSLVSNGISGTDNEKAQNSSPSVNTDQPVSDDGSTKRSSGEGNFVYENVVIGMDGSMESLAVGYIPAKIPVEDQERQTLKELEEWRQSKPRPKPKPEIDFNMQTDMPPVPDETYDNFKNQSKHFKKKSNDITDSQTIETGVGTDMDDMQGMNNKAFAVDDDFQLEIEAVTGLLDEVVFGKGRSTQTGDSLRLAHDRSNLMIQAMNRVNRPISDCTVVDSGTSMDDLNPRPSVKPVVMRRPTQTQQHNPSVTTSTSTSTSTSTGMTTGVPSIIPPPLKPKPDEVTRSRELIKQKESPSRSTPSPVPTKLEAGIGSDGTESILTSFSDEPPRRRKMCIAMSIIFVVIILGIIAAGVIVYFVVVQMESEGDLSEKSFYLGVDLRGRLYSADLEQTSSNAYGFVSSEICTYVKMSYENTIWSKGYRSCAIMDFREGVGGGTAAHVQMVFLKAEVTKREEQDINPAEEGLKYYLVRSLTQIQVGKEFARLYQPDINTMRIVKLWSQLGDFGTKPGSR